MSETGKPKKQISSCNCRCKFAKMIHYEFDEPKINKKSKYIYYPTNNIPSNYVCLHCNKNIMANDLDTITLVEPNKYF